MITIVYINGIRIDTYRKAVFINGEVYPFKKNMRGFNFCIAKNIIYVDGYELKGNKWKRTLKSFLYMLIN